MRLDKSLTIGPNDAPIWRRRWLPWAIWIGCAFGFMALMATVYFAAWLTHELDAQRDPRPHSMALLDTDRVLLADLASRGGERIAPPTPPADLPSPDRQPVAKTPAPEPERSPSSQTAPVSGLPAGLLVIRDHESGGDYQAYSATGCSDEHGTWSCGGAYQLSEQYASGWAAAAGYPGMSSQAQTWPPAVQDAVALDLYAKDPGTWCRYTDYC